MKDKIIEHLRNTSPKLCVLATTSKDNQPSAAVMAFAVKDDFTILLSTKKNTRKCQNIQENNKISLVVGWDLKAPTMQIDGTARIIFSGEEYENDENYYFSINPMDAQFKTEDLIFIEVKPHWVKYSDYSQNPPVIEEQAF